MPTENRITLTPDTPVRYLKGVGPKTAERFEKLGIVTLADLLCHYPRKYIDFTKPYSIAEAPADTECVVKAEVFAKPGGRILPGGRRMERVTAEAFFSALETGLTPEEQKKDKSTMPGMSDNPFDKVYLVTPTGGDDAMTERLTEKAKFHFDAELCATLAEAVELAHANTRRGLLVCGSEAAALEAAALLENR
jgi:hypothetical protein